MKKAIKRAKALRKANESASSTRCFTPEKHRPDCPERTKPDSVPKMNKRKGQSTKRTHLQVDDEEKQKVKETACRVCRRSFDTFDSYCHHYCPCPSSSSSEDEVDGTKNIICKICGRGFNTERRYAYHDRYCLPRGEDEEDVIDEPWLDGERQEYTSRQYADAAINYLNKDSNQQYKLVKPGAYQTAHIAYGPIIHFNFKAKAEDCPETQTFFAQLRIHPPKHPFEVDCCVNLGDDVPHWSSPLIHGCAYCRDAVHHPDPTREVPKLLKGVNHKESSWLYGEEVGHVSSDSTISDDNEDDLGSHSDSDWQNSFSDSE